MRRESERGRSRDSERTQSLEIHGGRRSVRCWHGVEGLNQRGGGKNLQWRSTAAPLANLPGSEEVLLLTLSSPPPSPDLLLNPFLLPPLPLCRGRKRSSTLRWSAALRAEWNLSKRGSAAKKPERRGKAVVALFLQEES